MSGLTLEITEGITEHANRVALKGVFAAFGDVLACWVPPIDRRGLDNASVRFANAQSAEAAKSACDAGQVFFQGLPLKVKWRIGGGPRVGNSDIGSAAGGGRSPSRERGRQRDEYRNRRSRSRRRRSRSRDRKVAKRSRSRDREKRFDKEVPAVEDAPPPQAMPPPAFNEALMELPATRPASVPLDVAVSAAFGGATSLPPPGVLPALPPVIDIDPVADLMRKKEAAEAREKRQAQLKRGPGVAALVQGALKRAQTMAKEKEEERELDEEKHALEKLEQEQQERDRKRKEEKARERDQALEAKKKPEIPPEVVKAEQERKEREAREKAEREARESAERARREAEEADARAKQEQATRDARVRAGVETAKRQQAARQAAQKDGLYGDMPDIGKDDELAEKRAREALQLQRNINLSLPSEDKSKIVFLDIDGVLRPARAGGFDILATETVNPDTTDFFPAAMNALRHIIERTGAVIVLSSEWRRTETLQDAIDQVLERHRLRPCYSATTTKVAEAKETPGGDPVRTFAERRAREISAWLRQHDQEVKGWVVLDDINLALADEDKRPSSEERKMMGSKLVQTWPLCGLTMGNAKTAVRILNGEMIHKVLVERPKAPGGGIAQASASAPSGTSTPLPGAGRQ
mmetsp:Transcript_42901/g.98432  ORF Transcript_42901/g.98432 Transcript_42901/m.98432 type:complete len:638 (-) Transcript_42901:109-2022(-)